VFIRYDLFLKYIIITSAFTKRNIDELFGSRILIITCKFDKQMINDKWRCQQSYILNYYNNYYHQTFIL
jgi:hypothetical protein